MHDARAGHNEEIHDYNDLHVFTRSRVRLAEHKPPKLVTEDIAQLHFLNTITSGFNAVLIYKSSHFYFRKISTSTLDFCPNPTNRDRFALPMVAL